MKHSLFFLLFLYLGVNGLAQIKWSADSVPSSHLQWSNYSTIYPGDIDESKPFLVAAIPYNGIYSNFDNIDTPLNLSFEGSLFGFTSSLYNKSLALYTFDSSEVYFLTPGVYENTAKDFEYRVSLDAKTIIKPWSEIVKFSDFSMNTFKKGCGFLGGYKTSWGHFLIVELRRKHADTTLCAATVYWKETKPAVRAVYSSQNMNDFFTLLKRPWDSSLKFSKLPSNLSFSSAENSIIFYLQEDIYKKEAVEYQLMRNGQIYRAWAANEYDNNFILLKTMKPGHYKLSIRFSKQRQNFSDYEFDILPQWYQTVTFKIIVGSQAIAFFGFLMMFLIARRQKRKLKLQQFDKEKRRLELKSIQSQLNPHFIFNALGSIQGLINKNDSSKANEYLTEFSSLLRDSLNNSKELVGLDTEIKTLETYIRLEQLRFNFNYSIVVEAGLNITSIEIPPLLIQPVIENAIKHGISALNANGSLLINFRRTGRDLFVDVHDNGVGFVTTTIRQGFGLKLTTERIALLNQSLENSSIKFSIDSNSKGGTNALFSFQNWI